MPFDKVSVVGLGYIGLPTAAILATRGLDVVGIDVSQDIIDTINAGGVHIVEPDLDIAVKSAVATGKLRATKVPEPADVFVIAVPTPFKEGRTPDLSYIEQASVMIAPVLAKGNLVILESTSPVGTTERVAEWMGAARRDLSFPQQAGETADISIAHCPERVLPGYVLQELVSNDRVIGGLSEASARHAEAFYENFVKGECVVTDTRTAEMCKLTENAFRDVNIALANELSVICDKLHINVWELIRLANRHPRVNILQPGPGVGGHCIAVDPWFIVSRSPEEARLIRAAREANDSKPEHVVQTVAEAAEQFKRPVVACLGLAYKADIDDLRESPAVSITKRLAELGVGEILAVEPNISDLPESLTDRDVELTALSDALGRANMILVLVDHKQFRKIPFSQVHSKVVVDTRGIWS